MQIAELNTYVNLGYINNSQMEFWRFIVQLAVSEMTFQNASRARKRKVKSIPKFCSDEHTRVPAEKQGYCPLGAVLQ